MPPSRVSHAGTTFCYPQCDVCRTACMTCMLTPPHSLLLDHHRSCQTGAVDSGYTACQVPCSRGVCNAAQVCTRYCPGNVPRLSPFRTAPRRTRARRTPEQVWSWE